jgi:hypothetical protein
MTRIAVVLSALAASTVIADIGTIDTVGGTIYEWQYEGPSLRRPPFPALPWPSIPSPAEEALNHPLYRWSLFAG